MGKLGQLFEQKYFDNPSIKAPYYEYKGYFLKSEDNVHYPVLLQFLKNEIVFYYCSERGSIQRVFFLTVDSDEVSQNQLSEKIENYWKAPLWSDGSEFFSIGISSNGLNIHYFSRFTGFEFNENKFKRYPSSAGNKKITITDNLIDFEYLNEKKETWYSDVNCICSEYINFRYLLLALLYEMQNADTFHHDGCYLKLKPTLLNNKLIAALSHKCEYCYQLKETMDKAEAKKNDNKETTDKAKAKNDEDLKLDARYIKAEKRWLSICLSSAYSEVFKSELFNNEEHEVKDVLFQKIGAKTRKDMAVDTVKKNDDIEIKKQALSFFISHYSLFRSMELYLRFPFNYVLVFLLLLIPFGDYFLKQTAGLFSIILPLIFLIGLVVMWIYYYHKYKINILLFFYHKMSVGIMTCWTALWASQSSLQFLTQLNNLTLFVISFVMLLFIYFYFVYVIDISFIKIQWYMILWKSLQIVIMSLLFSCVIGFYVIQASCHSDRILCDSENIVEIEWGSSIVQFVDNLLHPTKKPIFLYYPWKAFISLPLFSILIGVIFESLKSGQEVFKPL
jgi:hypothetical protein